MSGAHTRLALVFGAVVAGGAVAALPADPWDAVDGTSAWAHAHRQPPMTAAQTRSFMKRLARYVFDNHLRKDLTSEQRGMVYEYFDVARKGHFDQFVQGEALDTMHDGAWFAAALATAYRATGDPYYKEFLTRWLLPFYCKMLNHSDTLFSARQNDSRPGARPFDREHAFQEGEKGFVPYFWDDGGSVSLERRRDNHFLGPFPCTDNLAGRPNGLFLLDGYSHGSSNHLAQDLGVMLELGWLVLRESTEDADRRLAAEVAQAAMSLHACRMRHHGPIPMCVAPAALAAGDAALLRRVPDQDVPALWKPDNHQLRALYDFQPGRRYAFPGFADDQEYRYYFGLARHAGRPPRPLAFRTIYDAYTEPLLYRYYADDADVPAGINRFDLHPYYCKDGKPEDYRSDRKGPGGKPRPSGSRLGPQNMVCCGWALQLLRQDPGVWDEPYRRAFADDARVYLDDPAPGSKSDGRPTELSLGTTTFKLTATRTAFELQGECKEGTVTIILCARPDGQGSQARVTLHRDGAPRSVNDREEPLLSHCDITPAGTGFSFRVRLPYTVVKGQKAWATAVEHERYSIRVGAATRNLYMASSEAQVRAWLEHELAGGLRTWEAVFREKGFVPTGLGAGPPWDGFSDSGGYAHLLAAAAEWLLCLQGKRDWELHRVPAVGDAKNDR